MDEINALGVTCIEFVQEWLADYEGYFELVNHFANPYNLTEVLFPLVSVLDSVFAAQLLLCMAFGGWLNCVMKWWLLEDRPYWWVHSSSYYAHPPHIVQTPQSCETGPGSPSGHTAATALALTLAVTWTAHVAADRKWLIPSWAQKLGYTLCAVLLLSVMLARMYVAAHFPHQCLLGALVGLFLAPALCIYVSDPYIWQYGPHAGWYHVARRWHVASALATIAVAGVTYGALVACHHDPNYTVQLAYRWCEYPDSIRVTTTPLFALVQCTAYLLGWALAVTPVVAEYRHYTKGRSLILSAFATALSVYGYNYIDENIDIDSTVLFYIVQFLIFASKPVLMLRVIPYMAMWPFNREIKIKYD